MVTGPTPAAVTYAPPARFKGLPFEVLDRSAVLERKSDSEIGLRQRSGFHQLVLCTSGHGSHEVDFEPIACSKGTLFRIHPGQVQRFVPDRPFEAEMLVWPDTSHRSGPDTPAWYPGSDCPTTWQLDHSTSDRVRSWIAELRAVQASYDRSPTRGALLQSMLTTVLLRLELELPQGRANAAGLPDAYLAYRRAIEHRVYERPSVEVLAAEVGYSTRTLDRACKQVSGQTARGVLDERLVLELRRLLTHTDRSIGAIAADFGFDDASNFSKFVKRHTAMTPAKVRATG